MKKILFQNVILMVTCLLITSSLVAQSPQGIPYQAVMRNADGSVMASSAVSLTFMIHDGTANGMVVYQESHSLTSNAQGLVSCVVGNGVVLQGNSEASLSNINWGSGAKFLQVMMGDVDLGTQQMLSVPYALYSGRVGVRVSATGDTLEIGSNAVIVPGISAANPTALYSMGSGVTDVDGNFYPSIIINGQEWMQKNLAVTKYRNGNPISSELNDATWSSTTNGAFTIYNNDAANNVLYGKLYNWYAVNDSRGLCPTGWHVPGDGEWTFLINFLDNSQNPLINGTQSNKANKLKDLGTIESGTGYWRAPNTMADNESGFTGLPSGFRNYNGSFSDLGYNGYWWTSTEIDSNLAWTRHVNYYYTDITRHSLYKQDGFSVRCVRD